ncbi:hypothetical protein BS50DRAFT_611459 [Corynespora cassiicola Philippines]|uniref:Uncharacterized protein n=1 Tax=Corynespora cassiicola Philippines TaxID=1448308 RepID=A0A2T2NJ44_CORCC|nr:hypothetical protein BS50DRAFT_611459 [Corynespora cassiicola Philippines]
MAANAIPLHCNICPKKPKFSDVSHLLTHISSKGHLSNYYRVKVRSSTEDESRLLIEAYDRWYAEWNVEELMAERMSQKDKRRTRARPGVRATPVVKTEASGARAGRRNAASDNLLDPRLSEQQQVKIEASNTPAPTPHSGPVLRQRNFAPHMQYWAGGSRASSLSYTNQDYETSSEYSEPSERKQYRYNVEDSCAIEDDPADAVDDPMAGVYWPGMDLFDSATPEMRRKRNQKKDSSVVEQLELNSQDVEPTELIFTPHGSFKKQRRISNSIYDDEEDILIKSDSPRPALPRPVLLDMDPNASRRPRQSTRSGLFPQLARAQYGDGHGRSDYSYDLGRRVPKKQRAFDVFQDDEVSFAQPAAFNYLTAGYQPHPSPPPAPSFPAYKPCNDPFQFDTKENAPSVFQQSPFETHGHQTIGYQYQAYTYGLGQDQSAFQYHDNVYVNAYQQSDHDDDDQRTLTAPPSPSSG